MNTGNSGNLVVKSKLPPRSGSEALRQLNPIHKNGPQSFFILNFFLFPIPIDFVLRARSEKPWLATLLVMVSQEKYLLR